MNHIKEEWRHSTEPLSISKDDYGHIIERIAMRDSPVGIDAQCTHAIIIPYRQQISERLDPIEARRNGERR